MQNSMQNNMHKLWFSMHNTQNMQFNTIFKTICKKNCSIAAAICRFCWYWCTFTGIRKICKTWCKICKICRPDFNLQNMHSRLCWWCVDTIVAYISWISTYKVDNNPSESCTAWLHFSHQLCIAKHTEGILQFILDIRPRLVRTWTWNISIFSLFVFVY